MSRKAWLAVAIVSITLVVGVGTMFLTGVLPLSKPASTDAVSSAYISHAGDYTFMWWAYGWRGRSPEDTRVFCVQTNRYGLAFDVDEGTITHLGPIADPLPEVEAVAQSNDVILRLPPAQLRATLTVNGREYHSAGFSPPAHNARIIESGKFMQRMELLALRFEDDRGEPLEGMQGQMELLAWPDRLSLMFTITPTADIRLNDAQLALTLDPALTDWSDLGMAEEGESGRYLSPEGLSFAQPDEAQGGIACLNPTPGDGAVWGVIETKEGGLELQIQKGSDHLCRGNEGCSLAVVLVPAAEKATEVGRAVVAQESKPLSGEEIVAEGIGPYSGPLPVRFDRLHGWYEVALGRHDEGWSMGDDLDRLEQVRLVISNPDAAPRTVRLNFAKDYNFQGIVGMSPMIRDADGYPTGLPVQISKNWHGWVWFHGLTMLTVPAKSTIPLEFAMAYARWGGVPAASHAQLCLVGWGTHQLWDESAVGSYGESICYDPDVNLGRSMIDDMRPLMVWSMAKTPQDRVKWGWTNNVGGGDFLVLYTTHSVNRQYLTRVRTSYQSYCPNLTEVTYAGVTADGHVTARITASTARTDDYVRGIYRLRYDVLEDTPFKRLAFFQLGADGYNNHKIETIARGNAGGLVEAWDPEEVGFGYVRQGIACEGEELWFALYHAPAGQATSGAWANRGLIVRSWRASLGGADVPAPYASVFNTLDGMTSSFNVELSPPPDLTQLRKGDFVEAEVEMLILPQFAEDYYGPNEGLRAALAAHPDSWEPVWREAAGNALQVSMADGTLERRYPLQVRVDGHDRAELTVINGIGYVPITFAGLSRYRGLVLESNEGRGWQAIDQAVQGRDFWQTDYDAQEGRWALTFNVPLDQMGGAGASVRLRLRPE